MLFPLSAFIADQHSAESFQSATALLAQRQSTLPSTRKFPSLLWTAESSPIEAGVLRCAENSSVYGDSISPEAIHIRYAHSETETTPGVYTASGYADLTSTQHDG